MSMINSPYSPYGLLNLCSQGLNGKTEAELGQLLREALVDLARSKQLEASLRQESEVVLAWPMENVPQEPMEPTLPMVAVIVVVVV